MHFTGSATLVKFYGGKMFVHTLFRESIYSFTKFSNTVKYIFYWFEGQEKELNICRKSVYVNYGIENMD